MTPKRTRYPQPVYYKEGYKYQLVADYAVDISKDIPPLAQVDIDTKFVMLRGGVLVSRLGYAWDGPSGPTFDTPAGIFGSLPHDTLYGLCRAQLIDPELRPLIDKLFENMLLDGGMWGVRARAWFDGVTIGAAAHVRPDAEPPVLTAP